MTGIDSQADPLADLGPNPPRAAEKKARLIEMADFILAARKRRAPLAKIAERLGVSPDYLSQVMAEHHGEAWTMDKTPRLDKRKSKKKGVSRTSATDKVTAKAAGIRSADSAVKPNGLPTDSNQDRNTTTEPTVGPTLETAASPFLNMRDKKL